MTLICIDKQTKSSGECNISNKMNNQCIIILIRSIRAEWIEVHNKLSVSYLKITLINFDYNKINVDKLI